MQLLCTMNRTAINWENEDSGVRVKRGRGKRCRGKLDFLSFSNQKQIRNMENKQTNKQANKQMPCNIVASYRCVLKRIHLFHQTREVYLKYINYLPSGRSSAAMVPITIRNKQNKILIVILDLT